MSSVIDALYHLKYNPFKYGPYLSSFYSSIRDVDDDLLLAPLVIPLCCHPDFSKKLSSAVFGSKRKSTIWRTFDDRVKLHDLQERIDEFKDLTDQSFQYCLANDWLSVDAGSLNVGAGSNTNFIKQKCSISLGRLLSGHSVVEIYAFLGVKPR